LGNLSVKVKDFVKRHYLIIILIIVPLGAILFIGSIIAYNQTSYFCYSCHFNKGPYAFFDKNLEVHKDVDKNPFSCRKCHKDKTVQTIYNRFFKRNFHFSENAANLRLQTPINPRGTYSTEQCLICHQDRLEVEELSVHLIKSEKLKRIGLRFNKKLHHQFETFTQQDEVRYQQLTSKQFLNDEEKKEVALLEKIKIGNCGQCHLHVKKENEATKVDKTVNFVARNPITCAGCHEDADPLTHPGKPLAMPSVKTCQKCHHGKIHGKFLIFKADCEDTSDTTNCIKCHPYYNKSVDKRSFILR